jgi:hypothetical protein
MCRLSLIGLNKETRGFILGSCSAHLVGKYSLGLGFVFDFYERISFMFDDSTLVKSSFENDTMLRRSRVYRPVPTVLVITKGYMCLVRISLFTFLHSYRVVN